MGPHLHATHNICNTSLTIVDGFTRTTWLYLLKYKNQCVNVLQQNCVVELKHKHLIETGRTLSFQSNLPHFFWDEAVE